VAVAGHATPAALAATTVMAIAGRTALVTGATGPLGREVARQLHQRGAELVLTSRRRRALAALAVELGGAATVVADLRHAAQRSRLEVVAAACDIVVLAVDDGRPHHPVGVDLLAPVLLARAAAAEMTARRRGLIVVATTLDGRSRRGVALRGLTGSLARDVAEVGVVVATLTSPGVVGPAAVGDLARRVVRSIEGAPAVASGPRAA